MKNDINFSEMLHNVGGFFRRFHTLLFFLIVSGGLFIAIVMLLSVISLASTTATNPHQTVDSAFDEGTIQRLENGSGNTTDPSSRKNPFVE